MSVPPSSERADRGAAAAAETDRSDAAAPASEQGWLEAFLARHEAVAGSVHLLRNDELVLAAHVNLPPPVVDKTRRIPRGKGMAGLAWERDRVVSTCNLQADQSGDVQPGAKAVAAQAALAIPVRSAGGALRAVVGLAFLGDRDFSEQELSAFELAAQALPGGSRG